MNARRHGPRKVVVGTTMLPLWHPYPGLERRLRELAGVVDRMADEAAAAFPGAGLDIAALPEAAVGGGLDGSISDVAFPLEGAVGEVMGATARRHRCYIVLPMYLVESATTGRCTNAAVVLDRDGSGAGIYRKVFTTVNRSEAAVTPGSSFPIFECDFGRVGVQICYDMAFDEGWVALGRKGAELVVWPTQWPSRIHPAQRALQNRYFVLSSTWRSNASLTDPTGHIVREIRSEGVFVERIDLDYEILGWQPALQGGAAFDRAFGHRAGYRYSDEEDCGIFWSNDPSLPIADMVRMLGLEPRETELTRTRKALETLRGGPPSVD